MGTWEHPPETVALAEEKYCVDRLSLSAIGRDLGVHRNTLAKWRDLYGWDATRVELAQALATIRVNKIKARAKLLKSLLDDPDPQMGFAVSSLETLALKEIEMTRAGQLAETAPAKRVPVNSLTKLLTGSRKPLKSSSVGSWTIRQAWISKQSRTSSSPWTCCPASAPVWKIPDHLAWTVRTWTA